mgnify:FL=1
MKKIKIKKRTKKTNIKSNNKGNLSAFKRRFKKGNLGEKILIIIMLILLSVFILGFAFAIYIVISAPDFDVNNLYTKEASIVYDSENNEIARLGTENRQRVTYDDLPEVFVDALVATEDSRFFQHQGVDLARFIKASIGQVLGQSGAGGASTLTMQIAKQRYSGYESSGFKGLVRKFTDMYMSVFKLEKTYTKEQLIEFYVNIPDLGSSAFGIEQAAQTYFNKSISEVNLAEAALLVGLFQAPSAYNPINYPEKAEARRNQVLNLMKRHGYINDEECEIAKSIKVKDMIYNGSRSNNKNIGFINTVVEEVIKRTGKNPYIVSMKIKSTMIQSKQDVLNDLYAGTNKNLKWPNEYIRAGVAVTDVNTGAIVAVGANRKNDERNYNYATMIKRHPGSSAKPIFDYGPAIEYLNWSTGQMVVDDEYTYSNGGYIKNWDNRYKGIMTIKTALASSRNIPALYAFQQLSQNQIKTFVTGLGITPEYENGYINEAHSIGGFNGVNPLQMSAAYATFARGGVYIEPYSFTEIEFLDTGEIYTVTPEKRTVMSDSTAYMINAILTYAVKSGEVSAGSRSGTEVASKTGTSTIPAATKKGCTVKGDIIGDSWQVTYTPEYSYAVWVGYDENKGNTCLTSSAANTVKKAIVRQLTSKINSTNKIFTKPASVVTATIELETNPIQLASEYTPDNLKSVEYFKEGTVPDTESTRFSKLSAPTNIKADYVSGTNIVTLTWNGIDTPDAVSDTFLDNYFKENYGVWAEKYLGKRKEYNSANIGNFGYDIYVNNGSGYNYVAFSTGTTYTYTGTITNNTTFMVKSAYSIFKNNASDPITVTVNAINDNPGENISVELNGASNMTVAEYYNFIKNNKPLKVHSNNNDISDKASYTTTCLEELTGEECNVTSMDCTTSYILTHKAIYNGKSSKTIQRTLKAGC